jgi:hypothetical protein
MSGNTNNIYSKAKHLWTPALLTSTMSLEEKEEIKAKTKEFL